MAVEDILQGLISYPQFQIKLLKKRKNKDSVNQVFIDKLNEEIKEAQIVLYREAAKREGEEFSIENFAEMDLQCLMQLLGVFMPIVKLARQDSYLIGLEAKQITVRGENCMVRVGGGYVTIREYFNKYATKQCVSLYHEMAANSTTFVDTVLNVLQRNLAPAEVIEAYSSEMQNWEDVNSLFVLIATFLEQKTRELNSSPSRKSPKKKKKSRPADGDMFQ